MSNVAMPDKPLTILAIEDDAADAEILQRQLGQIAGFQFEFVHVPDPQRAVDELARREIDVAILDYQLGCGTGLDVLQQMRSSGDARPVVVLTGYGDGYTAAELMRAGADDYLVKTDLSPERLQRAIKRARDRSAHRKAEIESSHSRNALMEHIARTNIELSLSSRIDALTGALNRAAWTESIALEHERAVRYGRLYSVIMLDVDHFKAFNDSQGHPAGDECLQKIARCLLESCRGVDSVGRYGGEEFAILVPETTIEGAQTLAERIQRAVWNLAIPHPASPVAQRVTVSLGVAGAPAEGWEEVVRQADEALYVAKALGRNMVWRQGTAQPEVESDQGKEQRTVLMVDDDAADAELLRRALAELPEYQFQFVHRASVAAAREELALSQVGVLFLDYRLGAESGLELLRSLRGSGYLGPVIVVTGQGDEYAVADLMRAGADDYIAKADLSAGMLRRAIQNAESQQCRRRAEACNRQLLAKLQSAKKSLEGQNQRLAELYKAAHRRPVGPDRSPVFTPRSRCRRS